MMIKVTTRLNQIDGEYEKHVTPEWPKSIKLGVYVRVGFFFLQNSVKFD